MDNLNLNQWFFYRSLKTKLYPSYHDTIDRKGILIMNKKKREKIRLKYDNHCAYCGCVLGKTFHVDHIEPVGRYKDRVGGGWTILEDGERYYIPPIYEDKLTYPERDKEDNYNPSCPSCNIYKGSVDLEQFRIMLSKTINSLNQRNTQYKFAKRYGLIMETNIPVTFYFEKLNL